MTEQIAGQWLGEIAGTNAGKVILDLDDSGDRWDGHALVFDNDKTNPGVLVGLTIPKKALPQSLKSISVEPLHPTQPLVLDAAKLRADGGQFPREIDLTLKMDNGQLCATWKSDIETSGAAQLVRPDASAASSIVPIADIQTWADFARYVLTLEPNRYIFRGQPEPKRLRTCFHRSRRKDLVRFIRDDLIRAHYVLSGQTRHFFDIRDSLQNAAFITLLQHHGFPTPLLDWTHSPFVAAFFAYRRGQPRTSDADKIRVFVFDRASWISDFLQIQSITFVPPHFSVIEAYNFENPRAAPQQSISTVSNLDDIEAYIQHCEQTRGKAYLQAIDLPFSERRQVMEQLRTMGITAASLFPGLDGACEELRGRFFHPL
jgi:hypothetical protein